MLIVTPSGSQFVITPDPLGGWTISKIVHTQTHGTFERTFKTNDAGLSRVFEMDLRPPITESERRQCAHGYPWQCPHYPRFECIHSRPDRSLLAKIGVSNYETKVVPIQFKKKAGQLRMFEPNIHRVWKNRYTGKERPIVDDERPITGFKIVCKQMAVAVIEYEKRHDPKAARVLFWKIKPLLHGKKDEAWQHDMAERYQDKYPASTVAR